MKPFIVLAAVAGATASLPDHAEFSGQPVVSTSPVAGNHSVLWGQTLAAGTSRAKAAARPTGGIATMSRADSTPFTTAPYVFEVTSTVRAGNSSFRTVVATKTTPATTATGTDMVGPTKAWAKPTLKECFTHWRFCKKDCIALGWLTFFAPCGVCLDNCHNKGHFGPMS
ncbi:hypothetical protein MAPG_05963 [Magnaporthiopsis poae ATCC 64411]|uniref:ShKT domain-containing protein n=1 Tax=Magnaporthiopsis poae (strain ATCC 64411 / 73-15) TaxID=644358 RepID=A0A0C4E0S9_MAGP6|nr:hypothetical protein MAPG_05963 [Magnaporthiopsis poae ATCC 64411]